MSKSALMSRASPWHWSSGSARLSRQASPLSAPQSPSVPSTPGRRRNFRRRSRHGRGSRLSSSLGRTWSPSTPPSPVAGPAPRCPARARRVVLLATARDPGVQPRARGHMVTGDGQHQRADRTHRRRRGTQAAAQRRAGSISTRRQLLVGSPARRDEPSRDTRISAADLRARHRARPRLEAGARGERPAVCAGHAPEHAADAPPPTCRRAADSRARRRLPTLALEVGAATPVSASADRPRRTASSSESRLCGGSSPLCRSTTAGFGGGR